MYTGKLIEQMIKLVEDNGLVTEVIPRQDSYSYREWKVLRIVDNANGKEHLLPFSKDGEKLLGHSTSSIPTKSSLKVNYDDEPTNKWV
jgi:hypothetical protein